MLGKNIPVINQTKMVRAMNKYFRDLVPPDERELEKVVTVQQKGTDYRKNLYLNLI